MWSMRGILAMFGDKITTDHISPAGAIKLTSPAGKIFVGASGAPGRPSINTARGAAIMKS